MINDTFDVVVIGAGHAGCEAALAAARLGFETIMSKRLLSQSRLKRSLFFILSAGSEGTNLPDSGRMERKNRPPFHLPPADSRKDGKR